MLLWRRQGGKTFQFTPPRGERPGGGLLRATAFYFNSRPRVGSDVAGTAVQEEVRFQFTPPRGERLKM